LDLLIKLLENYAAKQSYALQIVVPNAKFGVERKSRNLIIKSLFGRK
jgi:hypothetical protein